MVHRPYRLLGDREIAVLRETALRCLTGWIDAWLARPIEVEMRCVAACEFDSTALADGRGGRWIHCSLGEGRWTAAFFGDQFSAELTDGLFGVGPGGQSRGSQSGLASSMVDRAVADLCRVVLAAFGEAGGNVEPRSSSEAPAATVWSRGSGAIVLDVLLAGERMPLVVAPESVLAACRLTSAVQRRRELVERRQAIRPQRIELLVSGGDAELDLGVLQTVAVGDVIRLTSRIEEPLVLTDSSGTRFGHACLGTLEGSKAIQLIKH